MSIQATAWAMKLELPAITKMVLVTLADHHSDVTGTCNPTVKRIAAISGTVQRTVERKIKEMEEMGLLTIIKKDRQDGSRTSNQYALSLGSVTDSPGGGVTDSPLEPGNPVEPDTLPDTDVSGVEEPGFYEKRILTQRSTPGESVTTSTPSEETAWINPTPQPPSPDMAVDIDVYFPPKSARTVEGVVSPHRTLMNWLDGIQGFPMPNGAANGKNLKWLLDNSYTAVQIQNCYHHLRKDHWRDDKVIDFGTIRRNIGAVTAFLESASDGKPGPDSTQDHYEREAQERVDNLQRLATELGRPVAEFQPEVPSV